MRTPLIPSSTEAELQPLRISRAEPLAEDVQLIELRHPAGDALPEFTAGAHVTLRVPNGMLRKYSLCNDPAERDRYVIAVKREAAGRGGSVSLVDNAKAGELIAVSAPRNDFPLDERAGRFIFIAGGIGITPILSMIRHLATAGRDRFHLYYCTRTAGATAFREELAAPGLHGRVTLHHDHGDPARSLDLWPVLERPSAAHIYCCGPRALMDAVRDMTGHWPAHAVHFESFGGVESAHRADDRPFAVRLARSGQRIEVPAATTLLEALRASGVRVLSSCESGTCGSCRVALLEGEAEHRDLVLAEHERAGNIMVCVSRARCAELVLDL